MITVKTAGLSGLRTAGPQAYPQESDASPREHPQQPSLADGLELRTYESLESLEELRAEWDALLEAFLHSTTFSTWEWLASWWRAYAEEDRLFVLALRDSRSSLMGLAALGLTSQRVGGARLRSLRLMGDGSHDSDNLDLPVRAGCEAEFSRALLDWMQQHSGAWDICQMRTLPAHSPMGNQLLNDLKARGWTVHMSTRPQSVVELPETWEAYLKGLSSKERGKVGLRARRLEKKYPVRIRKCVEPSELDAALETLFDLHGRHWRLRGLPGSFHAPARRRFYRELAPRLLARQRLEFWLLEIDARIVAAQFAFRHGKAVYSLQEGFDPEFSSDSVGYVLRAHVLRDLIARGVRTYDFLGGAGESKARWGARLKSYLDIEFARPRSKGHLPLALKHKGAGLIAWLRANLPDSVLLTLKRLSGRLPENN